MTFDEYYKSLVSSVGSGVRSATVSFDQQSSITTRLENYRESFSGVSLEEEMINLVKFQHFQKDRKRCTHEIHGTN